MDTKCSVFIAASVDGFIARMDGDIEWLHRPEYECPVLRGLTYDEFMTTVDALVMGRKTLDKVLSFPEWPYENTQSWCSHMGRYRYHQNCEAMSMCWPAIRYLSWRSLRLRV